jgi:hypothetical protein
LVDAEAVALGDFTQALSDVLKRPLIVAFAWLAGAEIHIPDAQVAGHEGFPVAAFDGPGDAGEVSKANYNALIQAAGRLPGVTLRGFTAEAASGSAAQLQKRLLREALAEGQRQAKTTADALGLRRVQLLRIDQRGGGPIRPMPYAMAARKGFNPDEARQPESSVSLDLDYCLS